MATKKVAQHGAEPLGIGHGHHTPKSTGSATHIHTPHSHDSEYAASASSQPNPVQHGYPATKSGRGDKAGGGKGKHTPSRLGSGKVK